MPSDIPESDWKAFRKLREIALERFCERVLSDVNRIAWARDSTFHDRYLQIYELIEKRDDQIARAFNDVRRSTMVMQLIAIRSLDLVTEEELLAFSPRTQAIVKEVTQSAKAATRGKKNSYRSSRPSR